ncbi:MAG: hypothetical protein A2079_07045 [Geobacteraceae bacterium GWC2_48_7]|nr:MAG: hypothetical protein A2079_07045 [Geobacteraceae bacterium GWC2_48_7]
MEELKHHEMNRLYRQASLLALVTIFYNMLEGMVSIWFGLSDETIALFGFGADSFVEVISGIAVWHMVRRAMRADPDSSRDAFERTSLRVTGGAFYLLTIGLICGAIINLLQGHVPQTTFWGIVISIISIFTMWLLIRAKKKVGHALSSAAILADAACTRTCLQLSGVLLVSSIGYELSGFGYFDSIGSLVIAWFAWKEGKEAFSKAAGESCCCCS